MPDQFPFVVLVDITFKNKGVDILLHSWPKERASRVGINFLESGIVV
jgi:hypothetical protein